MALLDFLNQQQAGQQPDQQQMMDQPQQQEGQGPLDQQSVMDSVQYAAMLKGMGPEERQQFWPKVVTSLEDANPKYKGMLDPNTPPTDDMLDQMTKPIRDAQLSDDQKKFLKSSVAGEAKGSGVAALDFGGEDSGKEQPREMGKAAQNILEKQLITDKQQLDQVNQVYNAWDDEAFSYKGKAERFIAQTADKAGMASEEQKGLLQRRQQQESNIAVLFNAYRKAVTGAAASDTELKRLEKTYLNQKMSPAEARSARDNITKALIRDTEVHQDMLKNGLVAPESKGKVLDAYREEFEQKRALWKSEADTYVERFKKINPSASDADAIRFRHMKQFRGQ